ncbi:MAG TPA: hypothetical protein VK308_10080, partial [Pyrinomonadaceae bacterium]|nr:hypothetical protein [Pyrinomonadaceae bacterium]
RVGKENHLTEKEILELAEILPAELNFFAESLFWKRLREVEKLLPETKRILAADFENYFREFADQFTPESIKKHLEDAIEFANFLQTKEIAAVWAKDTAKFEQAKLEFNGYEKRFVFKMFDYDVREIFSHNAEKTESVIKKRKTFTLWLRIGEKARHFIR